MMMLLSYFIGQKYFPVNYNLQKAGAYLFLSVFLYFISDALAPEEQVTKIIFNTLLLIVFLTTAFLIERGKKIVI